MGKRTRWLPYSTSSAISGEGSARVLSRASEPYVVKRGAGSYCRVCGRNLWKATHVSRLEDVEPLLESRVAAEVHVEPRVHEGAAEHGHRAQARSRTEDLRKIQSVERKLFFSGVLIMPLDCEVVSSCYHTPLLQPRKASC